MELKNGEVFVAIQFLKEIYSNQWPVKASLEIGELKKALVGSFEVPDRVRIKLVERFAPDGTNKVSEDDECWPEFLKEYNELMNQTVDVDFKKVTLPMQINGEDVVISPDAMTALEKFVEFK